MISKIRILKFKIRVRYTHKDNLPCQYADICYLLVKVITKHHEVNTWLNHRACCSIIFENVYSHQKQESEQLLRYFSMGWVTCHQHCSGEKIVVVWDWEKRSTDDIQSRGMQSWNKVTFDLTVVTGNDAQNCLLGQHCWFPVTEFKSASNIV